MEARILILCDGLIIGWEEAVKSQETLPRRAEERKHHITGYVHKQGRDTWRHAAGGVSRGPGVCRSGERTRLACSVQPPVRGDFRFSILDFRLKEQLVSIRSAFQKKDRFRSGTGFQPVFREWRGRPARRRRSRRIGRKSGTGFQPVNVASPLHSGTGRQRSWAGCPCHPDPPRQARCPRHHARAPSVISFTMRNGGAV
jgi:hypothetical protein